MTERSVKLRRIVVLCVGAAFLLVLIGATIYCQTGYVSELPVVQLGRPEKGCLPLDAVLDTGEGVYFHYVQQEEGPWGQRYILRRSQAYNYMDMETAPCWSTRPSPWRNPSSSRPLCLWRS